MSELSQVLRELERRQILIRPKKLYRSPDFHEQNKAIDDDSRFKALKCTRRAGKSIGEAIAHCEIAQAYPGSRQIYGALTLDSAVEIIWDVFLELDNRFEIGIKADKTRRILNFPNSSRLRLFGVDSSEREMKKILGQKLRKASIDEAGSMTINMKRLCYQMIMPALSDLRPNSWLTLLGTCENIPRTFFEDVTEGRERTVKWSVHSWTAYENPHMVKAWTEEINELRANNPLIDQASWFKTHYLNQWCTDDNLMIIPLTLKNKIIRLPEYSYYYVLGVDLGYNDATSFSVLAYSPQSPDVYAVESFKKTEMDFTDTAKCIEKLQKDYPFQKIKVDGANKQGVMEMVNRFNLPLDPADKQDKATFLRILKDDVVQERFKVVMGKNNELETEWMQLQWKDENKDKEDPRCQNHISDATLYAWRECYQYTYRKPIPKTDINTDAFMKQHEISLQEKLSHENEKDELEKWYDQEVEGSFAAY